MAKFEVICTTLILSLSLLLGGCTSLHPEAQQETLVDLYDYQLIDSRSEIAEIVTVAQAVDNLKHNDVIFVGEYHTHPGNHLFEMDLMHTLNETNVPLILTMEQFSRDQQTIINRYLNGEIGEESFIQQTDAWNNYRSDYRPLIEYAKAYDIPVIATNGPTHIIRCVSRQGLAYLDTLPQAQRQTVSTELTFDDEAYTEKIMGTVPHQDNQTTNHNQYSNLFIAQVMRDETMAETLAETLNTYPGRVILHINGAFHSDSFLGTVYRLQNRRDDISVAVISPIQTPDFDLSLLSQDDLNAGTYLLALQPLPVQTINEAESKQIIEQAIIAAQAEFSC